MKRDLVLDIDEVVLSWNDPFFKYWNLCKSKAAYDESYCLAKMLNIPRPKINSMIQDFNSSVEFSRLPEKSGFLEGFEKFKGSYEIHVVSSCLGGSCDFLDQVTASYRIKNLQELGVCYKTITLLSWKDSKEVAFKKFKDAIVIEDNVKNGKIAKSLGHNVLILNNEFNYKQTDFQGFDSWGEIYKEIGELNA